MAERNSYVSKESYRVSCIDDIMNIPDMSTARELLRSWGIPTRGIRQKDEAVQKLVNHWKLNDKGDTVQEEVYTPKPLYVLLLLDLLMKLKYKQIIRFSVVNFIQYLHLLQKVTNINIYTPMSFACNEA